MTHEILPKGFTLRGSSGMSLTSLPAVVQRAIAFLDALPFQEVVTTRNLSEFVKVNVHTLQSNSKHPALAEYRFNVSATSTVIWGNKASIRELKKRMAKQNEDR
jgi:hypothetical protein